MAVTIYIYANNGTPIEIPDDAEEPLASNNSRLSSEEFKAALERLAVKFEEFAGPNVRPLSDYAVSREGLYEDHL